MYGFKLQIPHCLPQIDWACKTKIHQYEWKNKNKHNMIEFSFGKAVSRTVKLKDQPPRIFEGESFCCIVGDEEIESWAEDDVEVEVISVAVSFDDLSYVAKEFDDEDVVDEGVLLLPYRIEDLDEHKRQQLETFLNRCIQLFVEKGATSNVMIASIIFELLYEVDQLGRGKMKGLKDKYVNYYVLKTDSVLSQRYFEKLTLKGVASELGITPNYLSTIFKSSMGIGFSERLCEIRMNHVKKLLEQGELSLFEIAQNVGFDDENHLRRRFKQCFGVSIREYLCINKELTMYHQKPQRVKK